MKFHKRNIFYILFLVAILILQYLNAIETFENPIEDKLFQTGSRISNNIYVIGIDEETLEEYGSFNDFSRDKIAELIQALNEDEENAPAIIAVDISYYSKKDEETDEKLVQAVKEAGNVIFVSTATFGDTVEEGNQAIFFEEPFDELKEAALAVGHSNYQFDDDGVVRHAMPDIEYEDKTIHSFATTVYEEYCKKQGVETSINEKFMDDFFYIVYSGKPRTYYGSVGAGCSMSKVISGEYPTRAFKDSIVFIGAYASGMQDNYYTSIDKQNQMYGVEIHANIVNQLLNNEYKIELNDYTKLLPTLIVGLLMWILLNVLPINWMIVITPVFSGLYVFVCSIFYQSLNIILPVLIPSLVPLALLAIGIIAELVASRKERKRIIDKYSKFLSPVIAQRIADEGEEIVTLGGVSKNVAVLFADIRGFTSLAENLTPEKTVELLSGFYELTCDSIFKNEGMVDKFVGDETMAVFNAPTDIDNYIEKAVDAGLAMIEGYKTFDEKLPEELRGKVQFGIGVHCGEAVVGNVGTDQRMEYTAIGDVVNTASRIQSKAGGLQLYVSEEVIEQVGSLYEYKSIGKIAMKGKKDEMELYQILSKNIK